MAHSRDILIWSVLLGLLLIGLGATVVVLTSYITTIVHTMSDDPDTDKCPSPGNNVCIQGFVREDGTCDYRNNNAKFPCNSTCYTEGVNSTCDPTTGECKGLTCKGICKVAADCPVLIGTKANLTATCNYYDQCLYSVGSVVNPFEGSNNNTVYTVDQREYEEACWRTIDDLREGWIGCLDVSIANITGSFVCQFVFSCSILYA